MLEVTQDSLAELKAVFEGVLDGAWAHPQCSEDTADFSLYKRATICYHRHQETLEPAMEIQDKMCLTEH